jgi:hypothetical protein
VLFQKNANVIDVVPKYSETVKKLIKNVVDGK